MINRCERERSWLIGPVYWHNHDEYCWQLFHLRIRKSSSVDRSSDTNYSRRTLLDSSCLEKKFQYLIRSRIVQIDHSISRLECWQVTMSIDDVSLLLTQLAKWVWLSYSRARIWLVVLFSSLSTVPMESPHKPAAWVEKPMERRNSLSNSRCLYWSNVCEYS